MTLGPLTNIALALKRDPKLAERIGRCVVMGGAPCCEGNVTPAAEYNIWVDPEAARAVFRSKLNIEMVGWHVSRGASVLSDDEIAAIEALGTAKAKFAIESNTTAREAYRTQTGEIGLSLADPTAMAVALDRSIGLSWSRHRVAIESGSELTRGMTVVDRLNVHHDENNAHVWRERGRRARGRRHPVDPQLAPVQGYAEGRAGGLRARRRDLKWNPAAISLARRRRPIFCSTPGTRCIGALERRRSGRGQAARLPDPAVDRLRRLPLVPRDGARVVRERRDGSSHERAVRQHQSRSRRAAGHRPHLYDRAPCAGPAGRLAAHHVPVARRQADDRRDLLAARAALWPALVPAGSPIDRFRMAHAARSDGKPRPDPRRPSGETLGR